MLGANYFRVGIDPAVRVDRHDTLRCTTASRQAINPRNGELAIIDPEDRRIMIFANDRTLVHSCQQGDMNDDYTKFQTPSALAYSPQGTLAVCDAESCTIQVFGVLGRKFERMFGEPNQLKSPCGIGWIHEEQIVVLEGVKQGQIHIFTRHGILLASSMTTTLDRPVDFCVSVTGPIQCKDLWPPWFYADFPLDDLITYLAQTIGKAIMVRQDGSDKFQVLCKKREGRVHLMKKSDNNSKSAAAAELGSFDWMDIYYIDCNDGVYTLTLPVGIGRRRSTLRRSSAAPRPSVVANMISSLIITEEGKQQQAQQEPPQEPEDETLQYTNLSDAVQYLAKRKGCMWSKDCRRRHLFATVDRKAGNIQVYGYVGAQNYIKDLKSFPISAAAFFTMYKIDCKSAGGLFHPSSVCFDAFGSLLILDAGNHRLVVSRPSGLVLHTFPIGTASNVTNQVESIEEEIEEAEEEEDDKEKVVKPSAEAVTPPPVLPTKPSRRGLLRPTASVQKIENTLTAEPDIKQEVQQQQQQSNPSSKRGKRAYMGSAVYHYAKEKGGEGQLSLLMDGEIYTYHGAKRTGMGKLSTFEVANFHRVCELLTYPDGHQMARVSKTLHDSMIVMRKEWKLWPLTPRGLVTVKQSFVDWGQLANGEKIILIAPPHDEAPSEKVHHQVPRKIICRHWIKEGQCRYHKLKKCPTKLYAPDDTEIMSHDPMIDFDYGIFCCISQMYGCKFWYKNEDILKRLFNSLATERELWLRSNRQTANLKEVQINHVNTKVLDYPGFLRYMLIIAEHSLGLKPLQELKLFKGTDLAALERGSDEPYFIQSSTIQNYQIDKVIGLMNSMMK